MARTSKHKTAAAAQLPRVHVYNAGCYVRLSVSDGDSSDSNAITNQEDFLRQYIDNDPTLSFYRLYSDDGRSGSTYKRPGFEHMIEDIKAGVINCVVVKDLSRLGRNYIDTEDYLTKIFPFFKVRFIAVNDLVDTLIPEYDETTLNSKIKNIVNDFYVKQVSINVGNALDELAKQGVYHGPVPPYGYLINNTKKENRYLVIEEEYAAVVKTIFERFNAGESMYSIVKYLNEHSVTPPFKHFTDLGFYHTLKYSKAITWHRSTIKGILENPSYCGCLVESKHKCSLWRHIPSHKIPKEEWNLIEDTHELIISRELYGETQLKLAEKTKQYKQYVNKVADTKRENLFRGKIMCGYCNKGLKRDYYWNRTKTHRTYFWKCQGNSLKEVQGKCNHCYLKEKKLNTILVTTLKNYIKLLLDMQSLAARITSGKEHLSNTTGLNKKILKKQREYDGYVRLKKQLYGDLKAGIIDEDGFMFAKEGYTKQCKELTIQLQVLQKEPLEMDTAGASMDNWVNSIAKFIKTDTLTPEIINELISCIFVYSTNKIHVQFRFQDRFKEVEQLIQG